MKQNFFLTKDVKAYFILTLLITCGLATTTVTASKVVHIGINFPFSNLIFSIFTYPIIDCICELWGKQLAKQAVWIALICQIFIVLILQLSIITPHASFWTNQQAYQLVLSSSIKVILASSLAFLTSQILDITVYQKFKNASKGKLLWLRSNASTLIGQLVDSAIFITIVYSTSQHKLSIFLGSIILRIIISILMTPAIYLIVIKIDKYLESKTAAFKVESRDDQNNTDDVFLIKEN